jgi:hypothetical protein
MSGDLDDIYNYSLSVFNLIITLSYPGVKTGDVHYSKKEKTLMAIMLIGIAVLIFSGIPALLVITACVSAARSNRMDEAYQPASRAFL